jgi:hypothetical protein
MKNMVWILLTNKKVIIEFYLKILIKINNKKYIINNFIFLHFVNKYLDY